MKIISFLLMMTVISISAQTVKIIKVIDANLFELQDGRIVKLAGVDVPQLSHPSKYFQFAAENALEYSKINLLDRMVIIKSLSKPLNKDFEFVMMYKNYLFSRENISSKYLLEGFGKFYNNVDENSKKEFLDCEKNAVENKRGIWLSDSLSVNDTLDADFSNNTFTLENRFKKIDFTKHRRILPLYFEIPLELLAGAGMAIVTGIASGIILYSFDDHQGEFSGLGAAVGGTLIGYVLGFPTGVYLQASSQNPNVSLPLTLLTSAGLTAAMFGVREVLGFSKDEAWFLVAFTPIIGSLLYTHLLAPKQSSENNLSSIQPGYRHMDFYNSKLVFNMNILRINF